MPTTPLVSVLINNYNYGRFLRQAIDSALCQTRERLEVIVVDDGSTDGSREIIEGYGDRIIPVLKQNGGQASAFNAGFACSSGEIVCFLDADDFFAPDKVEEVCRTFELHPEIGWCFDRVRKFDHGTGEQIPPISNWKVGRLDVQHDMIAGSPPNIPTITSGISMRRSLLDRILPMPEIIRITSDGYVKLSAISLASGWQMAEELTFQRIHGSNLYTDRKAGKKLLISRTGLLTGICIWERFPKLQRLGTKLFSRNLGMCWMSGGFERDSRELTRTFWSRLSIYAKAKVLLEVLYWSARDLVLG